MIIKSEDHGENLSDNIWKSIVDGYAITLADFGELDNFTLTQFLIFVIYSFFVPILLLNMLIAIMSDSYERVMANAIPADCRQLASMLVELEQIMNFLSIKVKGIEIKNAFKFIIYSQ